LGEPIPERIANAPTLDAGMDFFISAFFELSTERQLGFGEGPIPISAIHAYCRHYEMDDDEEHEFVSCIRALDGAYLKRQNRSKSSGRVKGKGKGA
jgi:hypothetical protein